jgi:hypothetical protein
MMVFEKISETPGHPPITDIFPMRHPSIFGVAILQDFFIHSWPGSPERTIKTIAMPVKG